LVAVAAVAFSSSAEDEGPQVLPSEVVEGEVLVTVTGRGVLESRNNENLKCEVAGGSKILWIIPDGTRVEEGQKLVELDGSALETQILTQEIAVEKAAALKKQAEEDYKVAQKALREYDPEYGRPNADGSGAEASGVEASGVEAGADGSGADGSSADDSKETKGLYHKEEQTLRAAVQVAKANLKSAEHSLEHSLRMERKGYITKVQREAQEFAKEKAELDLTSAELALEVLKYATRDKMVTTLKSAVDAAKIRENAEVKAFNLESSKLADLRKQKERCTIRAPKAGIVVHANENSRGRGRDSTLRIEEGATVNAQQDIIRLPDLTDMQAKVMIGESRINRIKEGMPASVKLPNGKQYQGTVISIANQSDPKSWMNADIREYAVFVQIEGLKEALKSGWSAEVEILVDHKSKVLQVPVSAVVRLSSGDVAWVVTDKGREKRQLVLGLANDKVVEVREGLSKGETVVINPRAVEPEAQEAAAHERNIAKRFGGGKRPPGKASGDGPGKSGGPGPGNGGAPSKVPPVASPIAGGGIGAPAGKAAPAPSP
jgi:HlyD family secretion protein